MDFPEQVARAILDLPVLKANGAVYDSDTGVIMWKDKFAKKPTIHTLSFCNEVVVWSSGSEIAKFEYSDPEFIPTLERMIGSWRGWDHVFKLMRLDGKKLRIH